MVHFAVQKNGKPRCKCFQKRFNIFFTQNKIKVENALKNVEEKKELAEFLNLVHGFFGRDHFSGANPSPGKKRKTLNLGMKKFKWVHSKKKITSVKPYSRKSLSGSNMYYYYYDEIL